VPVDRWVCSRTAPRLCIRWIRWQKNATLDSRYATHKHCGKDAISSGAGRPVQNCVLRPTLAQTLGWGVCISTPAGRNGFYDMFTRGVERQEGFGSFTFPSNVSPYFPAKEWAETKATLPEDVFRQEYMAEFLEDSAGVFRGVDGCLAKTLLNLLGINKRSYSNPWTILNDIPKPDFLVHILWPKWPCAALLWTCAVHTTATSCQKETMFVQVT